MSYNNRYSSGSGGGGGYRNSYDHRRVNEDDVPESKHAIFIRGLPGKMSTDEIKDYFEDKIGPVSFDFVKTSPDNQRLFVAVRFESREDAKEAMDKYADRELLGYKVDISWFKDIRRFAQFQQATGRGGMRGRGGFRGRGTYRHGYDDRDGHRRDSERGRSRSRSGSRSSRSRSRSRSRGSSRSRSDRDSRSRSRSTSQPSRYARPNEDRRHRSRSADDKDHKLDNSREFDREHRRYKDKKNKGRSSSPESPTYSPRSPKRTPNRSRSRSPELRKPPPRLAKDSRDNEAMDMSDSRSPSPAPRLPPPLPAAPKASMRINIKPQEIEMPPVPAPTVAGVSFSLPIGLETEDEMPKVIRKQDSVATPPPSELPPPPYAPAQEFPAPPPQPRFRPIASDEPEPPKKKERLEVPLEYSPPAPPGLPPFVPVPTNAAPPTAPTQEEPYFPSVQVQPPHEEELKPRITQAAASAAYPSIRFGTLATPSIPTPPPEPNQATPTRVGLPRQLVVNGNGGKTPSTPSSTKYPETAKMFAQLKAFQKDIIKQIKVEEEAKEQGDSLTGRWLSTLSTQDEEANQEATKQALREQKIASMDEVDKERFMIQKRKLETQFRNDCDTFAFVARRLLAKDASLEKGIRMAFIENIEDLEKQLMEKVDRLLESS